MDHALLNEIIQLRSVFKKVYIYGYGSYGRNLFRIMNEHSIKVDGFVVTSKRGAIKQGNINVYSFDEVSAVDSGFILALNERNTLEVRKYLVKNGILEKQTVDAGRFLEKNGQKRGMSGNGSIEITTNIGCKVNCRFCPQKLFTRSYFKNDKDRTRIMSMDMFKTCLEYFPKDFDISFGGMSEPLLNPDSMEMFRLAVKSGRKVSLYTTLVGITEEDINELLKIDFEFVVLHCADKMGYASIPITETYYKCVERLIDGKKKNGSPFVNMCNAQTDPDEYIKEICKDKYEILTLMTNRAGNITEDGLIETGPLKGAIRCGNMGDKLNSNVLLPDGTVILCCMDYGMKHVLGNIQRETFHQLYSGQEMRLIRRGMSADAKPDILCRKCSYAREL